MLHYLLSFSQHNIQSYWGIELNICTLVNVLYNVIMYSALSNGLCK